MQVSSESYQNSISAKPGIEETATAAQPEKGSENTQNVNPSSSKDSIEISGQAAKLSRAELREQAALAKIQMLKQQSAPVTQTGAQTESGETFPEDPLTVFVNTMFTMMEERQEIQLENAAMQAERQKEEMDAAMLELEDARAEKRAAQEEAAPATDTPGLSKGAASAGSAAGSGAKTDSSESSKQTESGNGVRKGQGQPAAVYGKRGAPVKTGFAETSNQSSYRATA